MNLEAVKLAAADNLWSAIFPELMLGCLALLLLVLEIVLPKKHHVVIADVASAGLLGTLIGLFVNWNSGILGAETFNGLIHHTAQGQVMRAFFLLCALLVCLLARITLGFHHVDAGFRKVLEPAGMIEIEMGQHDVPHVLSGESERLDLAQRGVFLA